MYTYKTFVRTATDFASMARAKKRTKDTGLSLDEARRACANYNATRTPSQVASGTKMEFTRED
jgi:hypothetical protein